VSPENLADNRGDMGSVGRINNVQRLINDAFGQRTMRFLEMSGDETNPTELVATLIDQKTTTCWDGVG
jgi:hypothetical protein